MMHERGMTKSEISQAIDTVVNIDTAVKEKDSTLFNRVLDEETIFIGGLGKKFTDMIEYVKRYAQREIEHERKGRLNNEDPKIHYFNQCKKDLDLALPILEKIFNKTLMLCEYTLSPGHCRGLARACRFFDHKFVNRVFFSNCGIDDGEFAMILEGLVQLKDFKSIVYKAN